MISETFLEHNMRLTPEAEGYLKTLADDEIKDIILELMEEKKVFIKLDDVKKDKPKEVEVIRSNFRDTPAREFSPNFKCYPEKDITGKSRSSGKFENFVENINDRFNVMSRMIKNKATTATLVKFKQLEKMASEKVKVVCIVNDKRVSQKGNMIVEVEDDTDKCKIIIMQKNDKLFKEANMITNDQVIGFEGKLFKGMIIADRIIWPDIPFNHQLKPIKDPLSVLYMSDMHIGSKLFLDKVFQKTLDWIKEGNDISGRVKYICIAGDVVDGIGIYPNQEKELNILDIYKQYKLFGEFMEQIPEYIEIFVIPGNHDAVRRAQPQPRIPKELIDLNGRVHMLGGPAWVDIENFKHLIYHGDSLDSLIAQIPGLDYKQPEKAMVEVLKRRHLSPIYGTNPIVPEKKDMLVIDEVPDVLHMGHVHKNGASKYRETYVINSGTFQSRTEFQAKMGHVPTPGIVTIFDMDNLKLRNVKFYEEVKE